MKLVVDMIMGSMINAFSERLVLADKTGLNPQTLLDVLDLGAIANPMFRMKGPTMILNSYVPAFPLKHQHKDMRLALALGDVHVVPMPVVAAANEHSNKSRVCQPLEGLSDDEYISDGEYCDGKESDRREPEIFCRHLDHVNACGLNKTSLRLRFLLLTLQDATYLLLSAKRHDGFFSTWPKELHVLAQDQSAQNRSMMGIANISGSSCAMSFYCSFCWSSMLSLSDGSS